MEKRKTTEESDGGVAEARSSMELLHDTVSLHVDPRKLHSFFHDISTSTTASPEQVLVSNQCLKILASKFGSSDYFSLDACRDFVWERLNTGHWKDVDLRWRELYAVLCIIKVLCLVRLRQSSNCDTFELTKDLVKVCDMGLLLGASVLDNLCGRMAKALCELCREMEPPSDVKRQKLLPDEHQVPLPEVSRRDPWIKSIPELSVGDFVQEFMLTGTPVVVTGMMEDWPARSHRRWSVEYLRRVFGYRSVPVELGKRYTDDEWTQTIMTIGEFIDRHVTGEASVKGYLAQHQLFDQISELREDLEVPEYCYAGEEEDVDINSWMGPSNTISPLHTDPKHNFLCQVFGRKYIKLYREDQSQFLYPYPEDQLLSNTSQMDLEDVDLYKFPAFKEANGYNCILEEGQMLYIPPKCWHFVKSLSPSFSVSFWFQ